MSEVDWAARAGRLLQGELDRRGVTHRELVERLEALGIDEPVEGLADKIARGALSGAFMAQCLEAVGAPLINLDF